MRTRDPRIPRPRGPNPPELAAIAAKVNVAKNPPGALEGKTFDELRLILAEPNATDGLLHHALIDEGLELEP